MARRERVVSNRVDYLNLVEFCNSIEVEVLSNRVDLVQNNKISVSTLDNTKLNAIEDYIIDNGMDVVDLTIYEPKSKVVFVVF